MQEKTADSSHFFRRTEKLSAKLRLNRDELPDYMGISKRMFYGYRKGDYPISPKAWRKLEAAERKAGLDPPQSPGAEYKELISDLSSSGQQRVKDPDLMQEWVLLLEAAVVLAARGASEQFKEVLKECMKAEKRGRPAFTRIYKRETEMSEYMHLFEDLMRKLKPDPYEPHPKEEKTGS